MIGMLNNYHLRHNSPRLDYTINLFRQEIARYDMLYATDEMQTCSIRSNIIITQIGENKLMC